MERSELEKMVLEKIKEGVNEAKNKNYLKSLAHGGAAVALGVLIYHMGQNELTNALGYIACGFALENALTCAVDGYKAEKIEKKVDADIKKLEGE